MRDSSKLSSRLTTEWKERLNDDDRFALPGEQSVEHGADFVVVFEVLTDDDIAFGVDTAAAGTPAHLHELPDGQRREFLAIVFGQ